jgi:NUMOD3 motif
MNHQNIYESIIKKAKFENRIKHNGIYYENHHIIPRCLNGNDNDENLVLLTAKEHYVCHKLLTYIYKGNRKIALAFQYMTINKRGYPISSRDYAYARELIVSIPISEETRQKMKNRVFTEEHRKHMSEAGSGEKNSMFGLHGKDNPNFGSKRSYESRQKMKGRVKLPEEILAIIESNKRMRKLCPYCNKSIDHRNYKKWHGDNCKMKINITV